MGSIVGAVVQVGSALYTAHAQEQAAAANAGISRYNAQVADLQAAQALDQGEFAAGQIGSKSRVMVGDQRAAYAAQGIDVNSGSAAEVQQATQEISKRDIDTVRLNAMRAAWGYKTQAQSLRMAADAGIAAGNNQAIGSVLTGAAEAGKSLYSAYDKGAFSSRTSTSSYPVGDFNGSSDTATNALA